MIQFCLRLCLPWGPLALGCVAAALANPGAWPPLADVLELAPGFALATGFVLAWRFDRGRIGLCLLALAGLWVVLRGLPPPWNTPVARTVATALLPLNLAVFACLPDLRLLSRGGLLYLGGCAVEVGLLHGMLTARPAALQQSLAAVTGTLWGPLADLAHPLPALGFLAAAVIFALRHLWGRQLLDAALLWSLLPTWVAVTAGHGQSWSRDWGLTGAALVLLAALVEAFHFMAFRDELTRLPGRRALNEALAHQGRRYVIAMVDVDHFKRVNDRYGHDVGDQVLRMVAGLLRAAPGGGRAYRYGGEEFALVFPRRDLAAVRQPLEQLREAIAGTPFTLRRWPRPRKRPGDGRKPRRPRRQLKVTVSIGAAAPNAGRTDPGAVLKAADKALYRAKRKGRDRVEEG